MQCSGEIGLIPSAWKTHSQLLQQSLTPRCLRRVSKRARDLVLNCLSKAASFPERTLRTMLVTRGAVSHQYFYIQMQRCLVLVTVTGILTTAQPAFWQRRASISSTTGLTTEPGTPWAGLSVGPFIQVCCWSSADPKHTSRKGISGEGWVVCMEQSRECQLGEVGSSGDALLQGISGSSSFLTRLSAALLLIAS